MALVTTDAVPFLGASLLIARRDIAPASGSRSGSDDDFVDPNFFDDDYSVAATTGVCRVWEGAAVLVRHLGECEALRARLRGRRVLELGAGVGLCGLAAAAAGAHVLLTDLPAVVDEVLWENVRRNRREDDDRDDDRDGEDERRGEAPATSATSRAPTTTAFPPSSSSSTWSGATVPIVGPGRGTAASQALDWTKPVAAQLESQSRFARDALSRADAERAAGDDAAAEAFWRRRADPPRDPRRAAILLAAECVWLRELVEPFAETCATLMRPRGDAEACVLAFRDRSGARGVVPGSSGSSGGGSDVRSGGVVQQHSGGGAFVPAAAVLEAFAARGCGCATTATFPSEEDEGFFVHIFEITPPAE